MKKYLIILIAGLVFMSCTKKDSEEASSEGPTTIQVWHAMGGRNGELLDAISAEFNDNNTEYQINPVYKGNYVETMNSGISAFQAGDAPDVIMIFEVGTQSMLNSGAIIPVSELMEEVGESIDLSQFVEPVSGYYSGNNVLYSMPFNSSTPVLFYNKDAFSAAGLDPEDPPETWQELKVAADAIVASGFPAGFSVSWPSWTMIENFATWNGVPIATNNNGYDGNDANLKFEVNKEPFVSMLNDLYEWSANKSFVYGGRRNASEQLFTSGQVAMMITSSAAYNSYSQAEFNLGIAQLPYREDISTAPQNTIIGGASFWVFSGRSLEQKKAIAQFFKLLIRDDIQENWHEQTGYVPIVKSAYENLKNRGFYDEHKGLEIALEQLLNKPPLPYTRGIRIGNLPQIRDSFYAELENIINGDKDAQTGLDDYVANAQAIIDDFVANSAN